MREMMRLSLSDRSLWHCDEVIQRGSHLGKRAERAYRPDRARDGMTSIIRLWNVCADLSINAYMDHPDDQ